MQRREIILEEMRTRYLVSRPTGEFSEDGGHKKEHVFEYTLPFKSGESYIDSPVCGNAFAWAYCLGKNTRTEYERVIREEILRQAPSNICSRTIM